MMQLAFVTGDEDAVGVAAGDIERIDLPVLLIEKEEGLACGGRRDNLRARAHAVRSEANPAFGRTGALRRERALACGSALKSDDVARRKGVGLRQRERTPGMGKRTV